MTENVELRTPLAPKEDDTGDTDKGVNDHDKECIQCAPEAKSGERPHRETHHQAEYQAKPTDHCNRGYRVQARGMQPGNPARQ